MKYFLGTDVGNYLFDAIGKMVTLQGISLTLRQILAIVNVTKNVIIYKPTSSETGGSISGNVLTLNYDTSTHSDDDELMIVIDVDIPMSTKSTVPQNLSLDGDGVARPVQFAYVNTTSQLTNEEIIPAPGVDRTIRILSYALIVGPTNLDLTFTGALSPLTSPISAYGGIAFAGTLWGPAMQCENNTPFLLSTTQPERVTGHLSYVIV